MQPPECNSILQHQEGQASVFVLALVGVVIICAIFLYQSGRITSEKMQLQNAADAAAFGAMTLEARSLNFAAYTNRAMVANEVAVGQLLGLLSFADELKTTEEFADEYSTVIETFGQAIAAALAATVVLAELAAVVEAAVDFITGALETVGGVLSGIGETLEAIFDVVVGPAIKVLTFINHNIYSLSQEVYHGATYALVTKNIYQSLEDNTSGAELSDLGVIALVGHLPSYWSGYTKRYSTTKKKKKEDDKDKDKDKKDKNDGMGRFAATVREARDGFSSGEPEDMSRGWKIGFDINLAVLEFFFGFESLGGSEIRHKNETFDWSAADTLVGLADLRILKWHLGFPGVPFGAGGFQAIDKEADLLTPLDILPSGFYGSRDPDVYGGAGNFEHVAAWYALPGVVVEMEENSIQGYKGLAPYRDMTEMEEKKPGKFSIPFKAPFFLVGVTKSFNTVYDIGENKTKQFGGHFDLTQDTSGTNVDRMGVIAKSELYFSRPTDLSYFTRSDGEKEKPSVFSPFWQARLVDTSNFDRFLALALQQRVIWLREKDAHFIHADLLEPVLKLIDKVLGFAANIFNQIVKFFL